VVPAEVHAVQNRTRLHGSGVSCFSGLPDLQYLPYSQPNSPRWDIILGRKESQRTGWHLWRIADVQASSMDIPCRVHHQLRKAISYVSLATTRQLKKPRKPRPREAYRICHLHYPESPDFSPYESHR